MKPTNWNGTWMREHRAELQRMHPQMWNQEENANSKRRQMARTVMTNKGHPPQGKGGNKADAITGKVLNNTS